jgi:HSP90 family molecular chaperone
MIQDSGVGMSRDEMTEFLGRIGHSGTSKFLDNLKK